MSWKHWMAVLGVIGLGIVLQIADHDAASMDHPAAPAATASPTGAEAEPSGPYRTVALEVTGMT